MRVAAKKCGKLGVWSKNMSILVHPRYPEVIGVRSVTVLTRFIVHITFTDGTERDIDLEPHLHGPIFEPIYNNPEMFAAIFVDPIGQTIAWPNGADIAPETLYYADRPPLGQLTKPATALPGKKPVPKCPVSAYPNARPKSAPPLVKSRRL
jgi:hypothetical protein